MRISRAVDGATGRDRPASRPMTVRRCRADRRTGTPPAAGARRTRRPATWPSAGAEPDCERRRVRWRDPWQTPREAASWIRVGRGDCCTRALRPERDGPPRRGGRRPDALGFARSSRQTVAALGATCLQHGTTGPGAHPVAKAVLLGPATIVGLVGALHAALLCRRHPARRRKAIGAGESCGGDLAPRGSVSPGHANTTGARSRAATEPPPRRPVSSPCGHLLACRVPGPTLSTCVDKHVDALVGKERRCR